MANKRARPFITGAIIIAVLLILRLILPRVLSPAAGETAKFFTVFLTILSAFIVFIVFMARLLSGRISARLYTVIERILIAGILLGVVGMFQPWIMLGYRIGFQVVLASTLAFTVWGYVMPKSAHETGED